MVGSVAILQGVVLNSLPNLLYNALGQRPSDCVLASYDGLHCRKTFDK